ncbi:hypothetical protein [Puniceibacterium confluentis]|uniref:hypothetical protein n=1 Tax=Puniceibacterium confluentis TaxID=1958944 RepID=UPI0011B650EB|nr:hypothetical protein [Puniceibacterium confluentis]
MTLLIALYICVAVFALGMTRAERKRSGNTSVVLAGASLAACVAWPVTVLVMIVAIQRQRPARTAPQGSAQPA